jgi:Uma2 family endonuclease
MSETATVARANRAEFSLHEEDQLTESRRHSAQAVYWEQVLDRLLPGWFVARNFAVYWMPGQRQHPYAGPDILVSRFHPAPTRVRSEAVPAGEDQTVYLTYEDGPLTLVAEIASDRTRRGEQRKRDQIYAKGLQVPEYLYVDSQRDILQLGVLAGESYEWVRQDEQGRLWSPALGVGFAWQEDHRLVRVIAPDGTVMPTAQEAAALLETFEGRWEEERHRAETERQRAEAERQRAEALAAELERLRRATGEEGKA